MLLLTQSGERHEDHIPIISFETKEKMKEWLYQRVQIENAVGFQFVDNYSQVFLMVGHDGDFDIWYNILEFEFGKEFPRT